MQPASPATYRNRWHKPTDKHSGPACFTTEAQPVAYRGYLIYNRIAGTVGKGDGVWDVVKDGVCVSQYAGPTGARGGVDKLLAAGAEPAKI